MTVADPVVADETVLSSAEERRIRAALDLDPDGRATLGQFFTPVSIATLMAGMADPVSSDSLRILDPGAGSGSLTSAFVMAACQWPSPPSRITATLIEVDPCLESPLRETLEDCKTLCAERGIGFEGELHTTDFLESTALTIGSAELSTFDIAILNPPYRKIQTKSREREWARACGVEVSNLYAAFLAATIALLAPGGQMVAITPRSFTNGTYYRPFRRFLLDRTAPTKVHVFDSRDEAFREDGVLQENIIMHAKHQPWNVEDRVLISASQRPGEPIRTREVSGSSVVNRDDPECFIRLPIEDEHAEVASRMATLPATLEDLGLTVSTGPVVDFRVREYLRQEADADDAVPLLYPANLRDSEVSWPTADSRKPEAIVAAGEAERWLVPDGDYVLVRRFSAKEERRRVVAGVLRKGQLGYDQIGLENHLNYFHRNGQGLDQQAALGLAAYLNSSFVDTYVRVFNGHTQINATDLRSLRYPSSTELKQMAFDESAIDELIAEASGTANGN